MTADVWVAIELHRGHVAGIIILTAVLIAFACFLLGYYFFLRKRGKERKDQSEHQREDY